MRAIPPRQVPTVPQNGLGDAPPDGWQYTEIHYKTIGVRQTPVDPDDPSKGSYLDFAYQSYSNPILNQKIGDVIASILGGRHALERLTDPPTPLDFRVAAKGYVIFELADSIQWQFRPGYEAVTTGIDMSNDYGGLVHVLPDGTEFPMGSPVPAGCRLVYFAVKNIMPQNNPRLDTFNLNIEFVQSLVSGSDNEMIPLVLDPDITNQGGPHMGGGGWIG